MESVLPQSGQNPRSAYRDDLYLFGSLVTQMNESTGKWTKLAQGAPECLRQNSQWQITHRIGAAVALYRIAPHRHPPSKESVIVLELLRPHDNAQRPRRNRGATPKTKTKALPWAVNC